MAKTLSGQIPPLSPLYKTSYHHIPDDPPPHLYPQSQIQSQSQILQSHSSSSIKVQTPQRPSIYEIPISNQVGYIPPHIQVEGGMVGPSNYAYRGGNLGNVTPGMNSPMSVGGRSVVDHSPVRGSPGVGKQVRGGGGTGGMGDSFVMEGIERDVRGMVVDDGDGRVGVDDPFKEREYTEMKCLGDGSFGTVWLCDWHSAVKGGTLLSAMQCGAGARPEWVGKRLVALKRMKRVWEGGWDQARNLGEIVSLRRIPAHPAIIPLYDAFISPKSRELYFVFECMEGNLYQLTKSRRGRPLAAGLIASCFHQISSGLAHMHNYGYFHRDMKPENLLVTTTGLTDYLTATALTMINTNRTHAFDHMTEREKIEKDVSVIVKLADFGLARETMSKPPYTEYVSTRWYRAPEVLLRSTEYGAPVDMWALGTILAEMLNLKPLFPGVSEIDQVYRICEMMGDPGGNYGVDERGRGIGGGSWNSGIKLAKKVGFSFPKRVPVNFRGLFHESVPQSLVDCIADLLRYNPKYRLTSAQCLEHPYFHETLPHLQLQSPLPRIPFSKGQPAQHVSPTPIPPVSAPPRQIPPSHSHIPPQEPRPAFANGDMRTLPPPIGTPDNSRVFFPASADWSGPSALVNQLRELDLPTEDLSSYGHRPVGERPAGDRESKRFEAPNPGPSSGYDGSNYSGSNADLASTNSRYTLNPRALQMAETQPSKSQVQAFVQSQQPHIQGGYETPSQVSLPIPNSQPSGSGKLPSVLSGKKKKWGLSSVFGGGGGGSDKGSTSSLAPVDESPYTGSSSSLKRTQSGQPAHPIPAIQQVYSDDPKKAKKEAERVARELEKAKREATARAQKERARAVMMKRNQLVSEQGKLDQGVNLEFARGFGVVPAVPQPPASQQAEGININSNIDLTGQLHQQPVHTPSLSSHPLAQGSQSVTSIRSYESRRSGGTETRHSVHSGQSHSQPQLSSAALQAFERGNVAGGSRNKARRRDEDDDHSMSSFDMNSLRSRSVLTIGTVDSDPGPRRHRDDISPLPNFPNSISPRSKDPLIARQHRHQANSSSSLRLASKSNPSLESQLAHDFMNQASVHGHSAPPPPVPPIPSSAQYFMHGEAQGQGLGQGQGSLPTSPYGHPQGAAVSLGVGVGRDYGMVQGGGGTLPSIRTWEGQGEGDINPMFRVPAIPADGQETRGSTTLPPFSAIASVADTSPHPHHNQHNQR